MANLVLHIGTKKTGTTFLQRYLAANVSQLNKAGWTYPEYLGNVNHLELALPFEKKVSDAHLRWSMADPDSKARRAEASAARLAERVQPGQRWIMTSEFFSSRLQSPDEVQDAVDFLRRFFDQITVVVFFRRQEFTFPSIYSQTVKDGYRPFWSRDFCEKHLAELDYDAMYRRWSSAVGPENMRAMPYLESHKRDAAHFLQQFGAATGIEFGPDWVTPAESNVNRSLSAEGITFLRVINPYVPRVKPDGSSNHSQRQRVIAKVMELTSGPDFNPGPEVIDFVTEYYKSSNADLLARLPQDESWNEWQRQSGHSLKPTKEAADIRAGRVAELLVALSEPGGPMAWSRMDRASMLTMYVTERGARRVGFHRLPLIRQMHLSQRISEWLANRPAGRGLPWRERRALPRKRQG